MVAIFQYSVCAESRNCSRKLVTLSEILRMYAEVYLSSGFSLGSAAANLERDGSDPQSLRATREGLQFLIEECTQAGLPISAEYMQRSLAHLDNHGYSHWRLNEISNVLEIELSQRVFLQIEKRKEVYFETPRVGWEDTIKRFPECITDIEEMNRCFALSRYAACVFHSLLIAEWGIIRLGDHIGVTDPKKGWDATYKFLSGLMREGRNKLPPSLARQWDFLEQIHMCLEAMKLAWRNKVNHAAENLTVLQSDFTSEIAEEISVATRGFMRRLASGLP